MNGKYYIGIDPAATMGIAILPESENWAVVFDVKGDPIEQLTFFMPLLTNEILKAGGDLVFVIERLHVQRNAKTNRSLSERSGFFKFTLKSIGFPVYEVAPKVARKYLGTKSKLETHDLFVPCFIGKKLTDDHTDALAAALWARDRDFQEGFRVYDWQNFKSRQEAGQEHQGDTDDVQPEPARDGRTSRPG